MNELNIAAVDWQPTMEINSENTQPLEPVEHEHHAVEPGEIVNRLDSYTDTNDSGSGVDTCMGAWAVERAS